MAQLDSTRCGLKADTSKPHYIVTTKNVEEYLQKAINVMVKDLRDNGKNVRDVKITVMTNNVSKEFKPFLVALPIDGAAKGRSGNSDNLSIYQNEENDNNIQMHDWLFKFMSTFVYDKSDIRAFDSMMFRKELGITPAAANDLKRLARPKVHSVRDDRRPTHIIFYVDPIRVFKHMLRVSDDEKFKISIKKDECVDLNSGECEYSVYKIYDSSRRGKGSEREKLAKLLRNNINNKRN